MDRAIRAQKLFDKEYFAACIDEALLAGQEPNADKAELIFLVAKAMEKMRQYPQALGYANRVLERSPDHAQALAHRGSVLDRLFQKDAAKTDLTRAVQLDPNYVHAWESLFYVAFDTGDNATVDQALENLERLGAEKGYLYRLRGARRLEAGDREGGEADLRKACVHKLGNAIAADVMSQAGMAFQNGDEYAMCGVQRERDNPARAILSLQKALELGVSTPRRDLKVVERLAKLLIAENRNDEAVAAAEALTTRTSDQADTWLVRAAIDGKTESYEQAWKLSEEEGAVPYARHLLSLDRAKDALDVCNKRLSSEPDDAGALSADGRLRLATHPVRTRIVDVTSGDETTVLEGWWQLGAAWLPHGELCVLCSEGEVELDREDPEVRSLPSLAGAGLPTERLLRVSSAGLLHLVNVDTEYRYQISVKAERVQSSPDGRWVVLTRSSGAWRTAILAATPGGLVTIAKHPADIGTLALLRDRAFGSNGFELLGIDAAVATAPEGVVRAIEEKLTLEKPPPPPPTTLKLDEPSPLVLKRRTDAEPPPAADPPELQADVGWPTILVRRGG